MIPKIRDFKILFLKVTYIIFSSTATLSLTTTSVCGNEGDVITTIGLAVDNQVQDIGFTFGE